MTGWLEEIWRHPIKSHGREPLDAVTLSAGCTMPWDRTWAVAHEASPATEDAWSPCAAFSRVAKAPKLMAITSRLDETSARLTLHHPDLPDLTFDPDTQAQAFLTWVTPLMPTNRAASARIVRVKGRGMTDSDFPSLTLCSFTSHQAVEQNLGLPLSHLRWRGNLWFDGFDAWQEFEWLGRRVRVGEAEFEVRERTDRCAATTVNPDTGIQDADTIGALRDGWGHSDFGVRAEVIRGGTIRPGDPVEPV